MGWQQSAPPTARAGTSAVARTEPSALDAARSVASAGSHIQRIVPCVDVSLGGYAYIVTGELEVRLSCSPAASSVARRAARVLLAERCPPELLKDVLIVVSELVTIAVAHTGDPCVLVVQHTDETIVVEVRDTDARRRPETIAKRPVHDYGRGLGAVQALATRWGIERTEHGKSVWAEFGVSGR